MNALLKIMRTVLGLQGPSTLKTYDGPPYTSSQIMEATCKVLEISEMQFKGKRRAAEYVVARHIAMYLSVEMTQESYVQIGNNYNKDHTTVIYAHKKVAKRGKGRTPINRALNAVKNELAS